MKENIGIKIIIAGHHASKYERFPKYFNGREVIYGKTGDLIKHCEFAITRGSTAINFAVIYNKPIIFYTTKECELYQDIKDGILSFSSCFNKKPANIDKINADFNWDNLLSVEKHLYDNYMNNYIKLPNTEERNSWYIFKRHLLKDM